MSLKPSKSKIILPSEANRDDLIKILADEYDKAERLCKEVEEFRDEAGMPAINELRYAGYHLLTFVRSEVGSGQGDIEQIRSAISHCRRAAYEAAEAGIVSALSLITLFHAAYKTVVISDVLSNWIDIQKDCDQIRLEVADARRTGYIRDEDHEAYLEQFRKLRDHYNSTKYSEDDLNKKILDQKHGTRNFLITTVIALMALVVAISFGLRSN